MRSSALLAAKTAAVLSAWLLVELPGLLVLLIWRLSGGHIFTPETLCLLFGHFLYGVTVTFISLFAAAVAESASTAALLALACTLGSWVLDFAAGGWKFVASQNFELSLTALLKPFEQGLLVWRAVGGVAIMTAGLFALTLLWWHPGRPVVLKLRGTATVFVFCAALFRAFAPCRPFHRPHRGPAPLVLTSGAQRFATDSRTGPDYRLFLA